MDQRIQEFLLHQQLRGQVLEEKLEKSRYVQRDLEDQIEEEYKAEGKVYKRTEKVKDMSTSRAPRIVIQDVLDLLKKGYTRYEKDDKGYGSIQAHYGLNRSQVTQLFATQPKLKQKKTILPKFEVIDLEEEVEKEVEAVDEIINTVATEKNVEEETKTQPAPTREELFS